MRNSIIIGKAAMVIEANSSGHWELYCPSNVKSANDKVCFAGSCKKSSAVKKSFQMPKLEVIMTVAVTGRKRGNTICQKVRQRDAPSILAASSNSSGIDWIKPV